MPRAVHSAGDDTSGVEPVARILDPVLGPLGFAPGQPGVAEGEGQVIFCRGGTHSPDGGCVDLVVDLAALPDWQVVDVRYWGFSSDRWHLEFAPNAPLLDQLNDLARTLPGRLT